MATKKEIIKKKTQESRMDKGLTSPDILNLRSRSGAQGFPPMRNPMNSTPNAKVVGSSKGILKKAIKDRMKTINNSQNPITAGGKKGDIKPTPPIGKNSAGMY